jgi:hypothetical protein
MPKLSISFEESISFSHGKFEGQNIVLELSIILIKYCLIIINAYEMWRFGVRPRDKTPKSGVAHCKLSLSQESENEQIENQKMLVCFFDSQGIVHKEFVPPGQTVNQTFYG